MNFKKPSDQLASLKENSLLAASQPSPFYSKSLEVFNDPKSKILAKNSTVFASKLLKPTNNSAVVIMNPHQEKREKLEQKALFDSTSLISDFQLYLNTPNKARELQYLNKMTEFNNNIRNMANNYKNQTNPNNNLANSSINNSNQNVMDPFPSFQKFYIQKMKDFGFKSFSQNLQSTNSFFSASELGGINNGKSKVINTQTSYDFIDDHLIKSSAHKGMRDSIDASHDDYDYNNKYQIDAAKFENNHTNKIKLMLSQPKKSSIPKSSRTYSPTLIQCK